MLRACYDGERTAEQLSLRLGVPAAGLEDELKKLLEYDLVKKKGMAWQSNIVILSRKKLEAVEKNNEDDLKKAAAAVRACADANMDGLRALGFRGSGMPVNGLRWMLVSLILRRAYVDLPQSEVPLDYPTDCFGDACFRFLMELGLAKEEGGEILPNSPALMRRHSGIMKSGNKRGVRP